MDEPQHISHDSNARPLTGKTIVVTRPPHQAREFSSALESLGARIIAYPTIRICEPDSWADFDRCVGKMEEYGAVVFTSANAVECFFRRAPVTSVGEKTIYAVGTKTQEALRSHNIEVAVVPERFTADELLAVIAGMGVGEIRILYPHGNRDRGTLRDGLRHAGAHIDECIVYKTEYADSADSECVKQLLVDGAIDLITFFSPSSVDGFVESMIRVFPDRRSVQERLRSVDTAAIGSVTAEALRRNGATPAIIPTVSTGEALMRAIVDYYSS